MSSDDRINKLHEYRNCPPGGIASKTIAGGPALRQSRFGIFKMILVFIVYHMGCEIFHTKKITKGINSGNDLKKNL